MVCLQLQNVTKAFGSTCALQDLSWRLEDGHLGIVLGPSGSGKTTLLKIIAGLLLPDSGNILFDNHSVLKHDASERNCGYVPQSLALFPHLTVEKNLSFGLEARQWKKNDIRQRVEELLSLGEIKDLSKRYPREISGGQQQRVALLRALAPRPQILLLDEPLGSLDARLRSRMLSVIKSIQKATETTTVLVSHNPQETILGADTVLVIDDGRPIQAGDPWEVLHSPLVGASTILGVKNVFKATITHFEKGTLFLESPFGQLQVPLPESSGERNLVGIQIPPSRIKPSFKNRDDPSSLHLEGVISNVIYLGDQTEVTIEIPESNLMISMSLASHMVDSIKLETGTILKCGFSPSDIKPLWNTD
ncbi:MAG: ABC transporter ATP-binding protein [Candidatus Hodarchaeota archaeon]